MDLEKYQTLSGTTVAQADVARYTAVINRTNSLLDSALGYSLFPNKNLDIEELGKVQFQGQYPFYPFFPINLDTLLAPDEVTDGTYRLFPYNESDRYIKTDPMLNVYNVKLVQAQNDGEFVTFLDLKNFTQKQVRRFNKYIQKQDTWFLWNWYSYIKETFGKDGGFQLAVSADWLDCTNVPMDLQYLWVDIVTYYADPDVSVTGNIKSESVIGHSWTRGAAGGGKGWSKTSSSLRGGDLAPEQAEHGSAILTKYAGPNGSEANLIPTV